MGMFAATLADTGTIAAAAVTDRPPDAVDADGSSITISEACRIIVDLLRQLAAARGERDVYREMTSVALTQLHERNIEPKKERDSRFRLLAEYRALQGRPCR